MRGRTRARSRTRWRRGRCRRGSPIKSAGTFANDPSLTDAEIATISQLGRGRRAAGRPEGHADAAAVHRRVAARRARSDHRASRGSDSGDWRRLLSDADHHARPEGGSLDPRDRDPAEQPSGHTPLGDLRGQHRHDAADRHVRRARCVGRRHAGNGLSRGHGPVDSQGRDAAHQPALSPERHAANRSHADRTLLRQGRVEEGSRGRSRRQPAVHDSAERGESRTARHLRCGSGHRHRLVLPAHAPARPRHDDDRDLSRWSEAGDAAQRAGVRFQLAAVLLPEAQSGVAARDAARHRRALRQLARRTNTIRIRPRRCGSAKRPPPR